MKNKEEIQILLAYLRTMDGKETEFDEEAIAAAYQRNHEPQSLAIKIVSVFGGLLASLAFLGFLFITGLYDSEAGLLLLGSLCIAGAIWINKKFDKTLVDMVSVSAFIIGFILIGIGFGGLEINQNITYLVFIVIALLSLVIVHRYILSFVSVLVVNGSILALISSNNAFSLIAVYIAALVSFTTYIFLKEAKMITVGKALSKLYAPLRIGLVLSLFAALILFFRKDILPIPADVVWLSSAIIMLAIIYVVHTLLNLLNVTSAQHKTVVYIFSILILLPTAAAPAIAAALLVVLLSFLVNYKTGLFLGAIAFICFVSRYYYDLNFTLLTKSILMFVSGIFFLALYFFISRIATNENA